MSDSAPINEELLRRLPLPLAQLYRHAHNAKTPQDRHHAAFYLWEASLKLLGSIAVVGYAERKEQDPQLVGRLTNLARPAIGHWWEFVRLLVPILAEGGDEGFQAVRDLVLGRRRDNLPRLAGLDAALLGALEGSTDSRSAVRLTELFDRLVRYRNAEIGHGAVGLRSQDFYDKMGRALLAGLAELLAHLNILAGGRLVYIDEVRRQPSGNWLLERYDLTGESPQRLNLLEINVADLASLPHPQRVYLERRPAGHPGEPGSASMTDSLCCLYPLIDYVLDTEEIFFLNARRGQQRVEYLCYDSGRRVEHPNVIGEHRELLTHVLGISVQDEQIKQWAAHSVAEEPLREPTLRPTRCIGDFELLSELGRGGMGVVYRAWQPSLGRQVALKCLLHGAAKDEARFRREIQALGRVDHPHLIKVYTSGSDGEKWFYAMELIEGATLAAVCDQLSSRSSSAAELNMRTWQEAFSKAVDLSRHSERRLSEVEEFPTAAARVKPGSAPSGPVADSGQTARAARSRGYIDRIAELVRQTAEAVHALHLAGVIHRDIKPGNIMLSADSSQAVLMDLGLAQLADEAGGKLTRTRQIVGTLRYASPEQILAVGRLNARSDIYSLGVTLWELLTLRPMYGATEQTPDPELMQKIQYEEPGSIRKLNPSVPRDLEAIVQKCLEKNSNHRYATAQELIDDLQHFLNGEPVAARPVGPVTRTLRRARRRPARAAAVVLAAVLLPALVGSCVWYWNAYYRVTYEYYTDFEKHWGIPVGVGGLTSEQTRHRNYTLRFQRRGRRLERIDVINGHGRPSANQPISSYLETFESNQSNSVCSFEIHYKGEGTLSDETAYNAKGHEVYRYLYLTDAADMAQYTGEAGSAYLSGARANRVRFTRSLDGLDETVRLFDLDGVTRRPNRAGIYGVRLEHDHRGSISRATGLDAQDRPALNKDGYATIVLQHDDNGNLLGQSFLDAHGRLTRSSDGYARNAVEYDDFGNRIGFSAFDERGDRVSLKAGYSAWRAEFDRNGDQVRFAYFDAKDKPVLVEGVAGWWSRYNERGDETERAFFGLDSQPVVSNESIAGWRSRYDAKGNETARFFFGTDRQPALHGDGHAGVLYTYDDRGLLMGARYAGLDGQRVRVKNGTAGWAAEFNEQGLQTKTINLGPDGQPTLDLDGVAITVSDYDAWGNRNRVSYFGTDEKLILNKDGSAGWSAEYDDRGYQIKLSYLDTDGKPTVDNSGVAVWRSEYDDRGSETKRAYFGTDIKPILSNERIAGWESRYDDRGRETKRTCIGTDGRPTRHKDGNAGWTAEYDARGNQVVVVYLDESGKPVRIKDGYARVTKKYDEWGHVIEIAYFGPDGQPARHKDGYAGMDWVYNERGLRTVQTYFGVDGQPTLGDTGYAKGTAEYDARGNMIRASFFGLDGQPTLTNEGIAGWKSQFDERDHETWRACIGTDGRPTRHKDGYTVWTAEYDARGNQVVVVYLDESGKLVRTMDGYSRVTKRYDDRDRLVEETRSGFDPAKEGYASTIIRYDTQGHDVETAYFGPDNKPTRHKDGYSRLAKRFDARGNLIEMVSLDEAGRPVRDNTGYIGVTKKYDEQNRMMEETRSGFDPAKEGYASTIIRYDTQGHDVETAYFGPDNKPTRHKDGYSRLAKRFDARGNLIEMVSLDEAGRPVRDNTGYIGVTKKYDEQNRMMEETRSGFDPAKEGYASTIIRYDTQGHDVETAYFGPDNKPTRHKDGYSRLAKRFDARGNLIEMVSLDEAGRPVRDNTGYIGVTKRYDEQNRMIEETRSGFDPAKEGYASAIIRYDTQGHVVDWACFDESGKPVRIKDGYARVTKRYDEQGNLIEMVSLDEAGRPVRDNTGYIGVTKKYDEQNRMMEETRSGFDPAKEGYASTIIRYDTQGHDVETAYFGPDNKPTRHKDGYSRLAKRFDARGNLIEMVSLDEAGRPVRDNTGYIGVTKRYDEQNRMIEETRSGFDPAKEGYASAIIRYDTQGHVVDWACFDEAGKPMRKKNGYARVRQTYDERGNEIDRVYFDSDDKPVKTQVVVIRVVPDSEAARLGIKAGDVIVQYNKREVNGMLKYINEIKSEKPADPPKPLAVLRDGKTIAMEKRPGLLGAELTDRAVPDSTLSK